MGCGIRGLGFAVVKVGGTCRVHIVERKAAARGQGLGVTERDRIVASACYLSSSKTILAGIWLRRLQGLGWGV